MKPTLACLALVVLTVLGRAAINPNPPPAPLTAKEIAQGFREHTILARPHAAFLASIDQEEAREGVHIRRAFPRLGGVRVIQLGTNDTPAAAIARLRATGHYAYVEPDYLRYLQATPDDPRFVDGSQWALNNTGQGIGLAGADIKAVTAWDIIHDAPNVVVAVVDTGINLTHEDIAGNLWTNPDPTMNDVHGANFVGGGGAMVSGNPTDDDGHGTHVAGIIGAIGNNGVATAGVAWKVQLMAVKVFPPNAAGTVSEIAAGINYAIAHGANIINASYGAAAGSTGFSQTELDAITAARNAGIIFVAAAGNDTTNLDVTRSYPASFPLDNIVTVGASTDRDEVSTYSNYGAAVDLFAPGDDIVSLDYASNTGTVAMTGTSMATPFVSGALALLKAEFPTDTYRELINRLLRGVDRGSLFDGKAQTGGRLDLYRALTTTTNRPFNDDFADRPHFNTADLAIRADNAGATAETGEPTIAGVAPSTTLWWEWTAPASGTVTVSTAGSSYDTVLGVFTGTAVNALTPVAADDDDGSNVTSRLTFGAQAGVSYEIAVDGKNGASGLTLLNLGTTPANDAFANPVTLTGESTHVTATNANCTREPGEPTILGFAGGTSLWYQWTAPRTAHFQVAAVSQDFDPLLAVYTGTSLSSLTLVSASDNTGADNSQTGSLCSIDATAGTTYRITVDSKSPSTVGQFTLSLVDSLWQATTDAEVTGAPAVAPDGTVYVGSIDHSIYAFAPDGTQKWSFATGSTIDTSSPAIGDDGTVYVGSNDGKLYAFAPDGTLKWTHDFQTGSSVPVYAGTSPAIGADGTIYLRVTDGYLHALSPTDGTELWKAAIPSSDFSFYGSPVIAPDGTIYEGSDENDHQLYAFNSDGTAKWQFNADSGIYGTPAIDDAGNLYFTTLTGGVYSVTPAGRQRWYATSGGNISSSVALSSDGTTLYYAGYDAMLYARDTATGNVRWTYKLGDQVRASSPAVDANGVIYIGCYDDRIYAVYPDGSLKRVYDTGDIIRSSPTIAGGRLYCGSNDHKLYAFDLGVGSAGGPWPQYRANARRLGRAVSNQLGFDLQPKSATVVDGQPLTLRVAATGLAPLTYQWSKDGAPIPGATSETYTVSGAAPTTAGSYTVTVTNSQGTVTSQAATVSVVAAAPGRLTNVSVRTTAGAGDQILIVSFTVSGSGMKPLLIRGIGPTLATYGVTDALAAPQMQVVVAQTGTPVASNDGWGGSAALANTFSSVGAFALPVTSQDDALVAKLAANGYSVQITGANGTTGTALAEVYDLDPINPVPSAVITNISARAQVGTGGNILIAGFNISGNVPKQLLIRGIGPGLADYGVTNFLSDPKLEIYDANQKLIASNDDWATSTATSATFQAVGAFQLSTTSHDSALLISLPPGTYTAQVSGVNGATGVGLVEVYAMP